MAVHSAGTGTGWQEDIDVDQPHGLDYREFNDLRIGIRKRMDQEHSTFADTTAGAIHTPGGCAVLGVEYTDDCTAAVVADGTYWARGLVWAYSKDTSNYGVLFCATAAAGVSATGDWTVLKMHPDLQWAGGDVTWAGGHEFDASVDISGNVATDGDLTVDGKLAVDSSADFSDVYIDGDITVKGSLKIATDLTITGDMNVDGTSNLSSDVYMGGDADITGTLNLGANVSAAANGYITLPGGIILQWGTKTRTATNTNATFPLTFPNAVFRVVAQQDCTQSIDRNVGIYDVSAEGFSFYMAFAQQSPLYYMAIGN